LEAALAALEANLQFVKQRCLQRRDLSAIAKCIAEEASMLWCIVDEENMRNIVHAAILLDYVEIVHVVCSAVEHREFCSDAVNQYDAHGDSPLLLAARLFRMDHVKHLVASPCVDVSARAAEGKNFLHLLLGQLRFPSHCSALNVTGVANIVYTVLERDLSLVQDSDYSGATLLDYAIATRQSGLIAAVLMCGEKAEMENSFQYYENALRHAVLTNDVAVMSVVFPYFRIYCLNCFLDLARLPTEFKNAHHDKAELRRFCRIRLVDMITLCIKSCSFRSFSFLFSKEEVADVMHMKNSFGKYIIEEACYEAKDVPLQVLRLLLMKYSSLEVSFEDTFDNIQYSSLDSYSRPDNILSICSMHGDVDCLRSILSIVSHRGPFRAKISDWRLHHDGIFYAVGHRKFKSSPIMAAVQGRLSDAGRPHFKTDCLRNLKYLLGTSEFISLINFPEAVQLIGYSKREFRTPLMVALESRDLEAVDALLEVGAHPLAEAPAFSMGAFCGHIYTHTFI
jgi:hypothetical protein